MNGDPTVYTVSHTCKMAQRDSWDRVKRMKHATSQIHLTMIPEDNVSGNSK
jgi:hypothetical protein